MMAAQDAGVPRDTKQALARWRRSCEERGTAMRVACAFVGIVYDDGPDGFTRDEAKSSQAMQRACDLGLRLACEWKRVHPGP